MLGIVKLVNKYKFDLPDDLILLFKNLYNISTSLEMIDPEIDMLTVCKDVFEELEIRKYLKNMIIKSKTLDFFDYLIYLDLNKRRY